MATELENRLRTILEEKLNKIKPENIKSGVKIFLFGLSNLLL